MSIDACAGHRRPPVSHSLLTILFFSYLEKSCLFHSGFLKTCSNLLTMTPTGMNFKYMNKTNDIFHLPCQKSFWRMLLFSQNVLVLFGVLFWSAPSFVAITKNRNNWSLSVCVIKLIKLYKTFRRSLRMPMDRRLEMEPPHGCLIIQPKVLDKDLARLTRVVAVRWTTSSTSELVKYLKNNLLPP